MTLLEVRNVSKKGPGDFALKNISFTQQKLEKIGIAGETGAGKSTVLKLIAGLLQPDGGELIFEKERITGPNDKLIPGHPGIAYLSQHFELPKSLRVEQVLEYSNQLSNRDAANLYGICEIDHLLKRRTDELSGGEKQRVAVCRLLISRPRLLLLDEPYSHLDMVHKNTLKEVIRNIGQKLKITCMLVSHDPQDTLSWADKIIVMKNGAVVQTGAPEEIYHQPADEYTGGLFGKYNLLGPEEFKSFSRLPAIKKKLAAGKGNIFVRPEHFRIVRKAEGALRGTVEDVRYYGTYREVDVRIAHKLITVRTTVSGMTTGQSVYVSVLGQGLWNV